ncbi:UNVERIFIED_CONTAM: Gamma-glutamyl hydrolase 2 [Sesamum radiatum]|uniref:folate gamma-glutamyl hydrolase n=1 Tax=Sesamum radiatum TaxID=300843 RepID=A0AAW2T3W8_SESRA
MPSVEKMESCSDGSYICCIQSVLLKNDAGDHFPLLAICLGFELLAMIVAKLTMMFIYFMSAECVHPYNELISFHVSTGAMFRFHYLANRTGASWRSLIPKMIRLPCTYKKNLNINGTVFERFPPLLLKKLTVDCLVMENHRHGISPERFRKNKNLKSFFKILTTSICKDNKTYVSTVQARRYPVTAFQWHPEKNAFEWGSPKIPHSEDAVQVTQNVANFLVREARKSATRPSSVDVLDNLIYKYKPTYCGKAGRGFDQGSRDRQWWPALGYQSALKSPNWWREIKSPFEREKQKEKKLRPFSGPLCRIRPVSTGPRRWPKLKPLVSYKWLSRNFLVSSNAAKRLLQEFVEKYGNGLEVIYSLSGWLKNNPSTYHITLVPKHKLSDAKQEFDENCSIQVYSVQACLPKDPATLWNHEFVQAEDLFKQSLTLDNCLRDNRFCGVSNSFVKRSVGPAGGAALCTETQQVKTPGGLGLAKSHSAHQTKALPQPQQKNLQQSGPNAGVPSPDIAKTVKTESHVKVDRVQGAQLAADKEKVSQLLSNNRKDQSDKNSSGSGGALARWACHAKSKPDAPLVQANNSRQNSAASAEAQICARESAEYGSSDEDGQDFNIKRTSNGEGGRKRRVVFDYSDEEDEYRDAISLASPDPPKKSTLCSKDASLKDKVADAGPKRRKVLKTRIDERGREVTEVVWEGEEPDTKSDSNSGKVAETNTVKNAINRPPVARKSPAVGNSAPGNQAGKAGNKKAGNKDPKQGNILSFFKKV